MLLCASSAVAQSARDHAVGLHHIEREGRLLLVIDTLGLRPSSVQVAWKGQGSVDWNVLDSIPSSGVVDLTSVASDGGSIDVQCLAERVDTGGRAVPASGYAAIRHTNASAAPQRVALVVDVQAAEALDAELRQFRDDLRSEGWSTQIITVPASRDHRAAPQVRAVIHNAYTSPHHSPLTHVVLIGAVPIPYSGGFSVQGVYPPPDGHHNHGGAWSADAYYADMEIAPGIDAGSAWTDSDVDIADTGNVFRTENANVPGDGKFDQCVIPSDVELAIGRIDMADMPAFGTLPANREQEFALLRRYFAKNHRYRTAGRSIPLRAMIDDNFHGFTYENEGQRIHEAFAASAWRSFAPIVNDIVAGDWTPESAERPSLDTTQCLLTYACGGGGFTHCSYVTTTQDLVTQPLRSPFTMLFGSYFGDVAAQDNIMRAVIAAQGDALVCGWSGRPHWLLHPLAAGATIGECLVETQRNAGTYRGAALVSLDNGTTTPFRLGERGVHIQLVGDPTLRLPGPLLGSTSVRAVTAPGPPTVEIDVRTADSAWVLVETATSADGPWQQAVAPFFLLPGTGRTLRAAVPSTGGVVRVRPYLHGETRNGRLWTWVWGRGTLVPFGTTSVANTVSDTDVPPTWDANTVVTDMLGRRVAPGATTPPGIYGWQARTASGLWIVR